MASESEKVMFNKTFFSMLGCGVPLILISFFLIGRPKILDILFGVGFWVINALGFWQPGPFWLQNKPLLGLFCLFLWPIFVSFLISYTFTYLFLFYWKNYKEGYNVYIFCTIILLFIFMMTYKGEIPVFSISFSKYAGSNY